MALVLIGGFRRTQQRGQAHLKGVHRLDGCTGGFESRELRPFRLCREQCPRALREESGYLGREAQLRFLALDSWTTGSSELTPEGARIIVGLERARGAFVTCLDTPTLAYAIVRISEGFLYADLIADRSPDIGRALTVIEALLNGLDLAERSAAATVSEPIALPPTGLRLLRPCLIGPDA